MEIFPYLLETNRFGLKKLLLQWCSSFQLLDADSFFLPPNDTDLLLKAAILPVHRIDDTNHHLLLDRSHLQTVKLRVGIVHPLLKSFLQHPYINLFDDWCLQSFLFPFPPQRLSTKQSNRFFSLLPLFFEFMKRTSIFNCGHLWDNIQHNVIGPQEFPLLILQVVPS